MLEIIKAIVYGIVEGITEWLPISSTGHLILVERLIPFQETGDGFFQMFDVVIQLGAILAVVVLFWNKIWPFYSKKNLRSRKGDMADGRHFWRVIDNLMNNICKYAQPETRVYINLEQTGEKVQITFRNTSRYPLNISSEELMERFVRGDSSRNTEGNGLGLSIAGSLMELMHGKMHLVVDGDLFKVVLEFDRCEVS